jgi:hypothetical protein
LNKGRSEVKTSLKIELTPSKFLNIGLMCFIVFAMFFTSATSQTEEQLPYDPWVDINDDGIIDLYDLSNIGSRWETTGTPINKTGLLLELQAEVDSLNSSLTELQSRMESDMSQSGRLVQLPFGSTERQKKNGAYEYWVSRKNILHSLDLNQSMPGDQRSIFVLTNTTIVVTGRFQLWRRFNVIKQSFFIYSWTPTWPPPNSSYYYPLYDGVPGPYPGVTVSFTFNLTVPSTEGIYYLYYCGEAQFGMNGAVNLFTDPLWVPYAVIVAGPET